MKTKNNFISSVFLILFFSTSTYAATVDYSFTKLPNNKPVQTDLSGQLNVSLDDSNPNGALFIFSNSAVIESSITQAVFGDDSSIFTSITLHSSHNNVKFTKIDNLGGDDYKFKKTFSQSATGTKKGVDANDEWVSFFGIYAANQDFESLTASILAESFHIGIHVQSIAPYGGSDKYTLNQQVPLPAALWLFAPALLGFLGFRRKNKV